LASKELREAQLRIIEGVTWDSGDGRGEALFGFDADQKIAASRVCKRGHGTEKLDDLLIALGGHRLLEFYSVLLSPHAYERLKVVRVYLVKRLMDHRGDPRGLRRGGLRVTRVLNAYQRIVWRAHAAVLSREIVHPLTL